MTQHVLLVDSDKDWKSDFPDLPVATAGSYLREERFRAAKSLRVINLCRSYDYLSLGYYCSLLAEARGHRVIPSVKTIRDLFQRPVQSSRARSLGKRVLNALELESGGSDRVRVFVAFGQSLLPELAKLCRELFEIYRCPMMRIEFRRNGEWRLWRVRAATLHRLSQVEEELLGQALLAHTKKPWRSPRAPKVARYDLAILQDPDEALPPSGPRALAKFVSAGEELGIATELVRRKDYSRIGEFDALFIRETTAIEHHTYRWAKRAEDEGLAVIDDPSSILHCTNKVYLAELLAAKHVPTPKTVLFRKGETQRVADELGFPIVIKVPDGSFSRGVFKAEKLAQLDELAHRLFADSEILLAQEFLYTPFDWRIGILGGQPLFACRYGMSRGHWQILNHEVKGRPTAGTHATLPIEQAPEAVVATALKAARLIGDGLYGVDVKQHERGVVVIEVNDNPNLDAGVEDEVLGMELYRRVLRHLIRTVDRIRNG